MTGLFGLQRALSTDARQILQLQLYWSYLSKCSVDNPTCVKFYKYFKQNVLQVSKQKQPFNHKVPSVTDRAIIIKVGFGGAAQMKHI